MLFGAKYNHTDRFSVSPKEGKNFSIPKASGPSFLLVLTTKDLCLSFSEELKFLCSYTNVTDVRHLNGLL